MPIVLPLHLDPCSHLTDKMDNGIGAIGKAMQKPQPRRAEGEWWADMAGVCHQD